MKIIKEILRQDSCGANCAGKAANEPPSARKGGSCRLPRSRMVSTLMAFRKRNTGEFTELDGRFRGRERKAGESSLRVSMTRPWGTRALLALRLLSGGNNFRQNAAFRKNRTARSHADEVRTTSFAQEIRPTAECCRNFQFAPWEGGRYPNSPFFLSHPHLARPPLIFWLSLFVLIDASLRPRQTYDLPPPD